jgi:accessory gene regulator protein AgrB
MIGQDYKPEGFFKFVWDKAKDSIVLTLVALTLTVLAFIMTPDMVENNPLWLVVFLDVVLLASTFANIYHPFTIWWKLKRNEEKNKKKGL